MSNENYKKLEQSTFVQYVDKLRTTYAIGKPIVSDTHFDEVVDYGVSLGWIGRKDLPSILEGELSDAKKENHFAPMISLPALHVDKLFVGDFYDLDKDSQSLRHDLMSKIISKCYTKETQISMVYKYDGCALNIQYINGKLDKILTRGEYIKGFDVTEKFRFHVPQEINTTDEFIELRGEAVIKRDVFDSKYSLETGAGKYKNERNFVSGVINAKMSELIEKERMDFIGDIDIIIFKIVKFDGVINENPYNNTYIFSNNDYEELLEMIGESNRPKYIQFFKTISDVHSTDWIGKLRNFILEQFNMFDSLRDDFEYRTDGVIIICNDDNHISDKEYFHSYALKFLAPKKATKIIGIDWSVTTSGEMFPTALIEPIELDGSIVSRASVFNIEYMMENGWGIGAEVVVAKSGDIIPDIKKTITRVEITNDIDVLNVDENLRLELLGLTNIENKFIKYQQEIKKNVFIDRYKLLSTDAEQSLKRFVSGMEKLKLHRNGESIFTELYNNIVSMNIITEFKTITPLIFMELLIDGKCFNTFESFCNELGLRSELKNNKTLYDNLVERVNNMPLDMMIQAIRFPNIGESTSHEIAKELMGLDYSFEGKEKQAIIDTKLSDEMNFIIDEIELFNMNHVKPKVIVDESVETKYYILTGSPKSAGFKTKNVFISEILDNDTNNVWIQTKKFTEANYLITDDLSSTSSKMKKAKSNNVNIVTYESFK